MANLSKTTKDHEEIRRWAEERGGKPSHVKSTGSSEDIGILRIDFPGFSGQGSLEPITWEEWFEKFDDRDLALIYQEETAGGQRSNFNKIVSSETAAENEGRSSGGRGNKSGSKKASRKASKKPSRKTAAKSSKKSAKKAGSSRRGASKKKSAKTASKGRSGAKKTSSRSRGKKSTGKKSAGKKTAGNKTAAKKRR